MLSHRQKANMPEALMLYKKIYLDKVNNYQDLKINQF